MPRFVFVPESVSGLGNCSHRTGDYMANAIYHVFGAGSATAEDLRYIGWTQKSLSEDKEQIVSDLVQSGCNAIANWVGEVVRGGTISIFEIESASSAEDAKDAATFWGLYFRSLGLEVITDRN
jgi:hypothetical protein